MTARVPMTVLGGFLGAGKTTLLNRILSGDHGVRYAVLVNDFGELDVDGRLVAAHGGDTITFANGCVCCSMGDDLVGTIDRLLDGNRRPDQILVEASGVADPAPIADVATLHPGLSRDLVVVLADAETLRSRHEDRRLRETVARQLDAADLLVLNRCDRVSEEECEATESWVRDRACVPLIRAINANVPMGLLSVTQAEASAPEPAADAPGRATDADVATLPLSTASEPAADAPGCATDADAATMPLSTVPVPATNSPKHDHRFVSRTVPCPDPIDPERLRAALTALLPRVLRAKGFVITAGGGVGGAEEEWMAVQACGRTVELEHRRPSPNPGMAPFPGLVFIGLDDLPDEDELARAVRRASAISTP